MSILNDDNHAMLALGCSSVIWQHYGDPMTTYDTTNDDFLGGEFQGLEKTQIVNYAWCDGALIEGSMHKAKSSAIAN